MRFTQTMKSTHEITTTVDIDWDHDREPMQAHRATFPKLGGVRYYYSTEILARLGITRPEPPYEPQPGDVVQRMATKKIYWVINSWSQLPGVFGCVDILGCCSHLNSSELILLHRRPRSPTPPDVVTTTLGH